MSFRTRRREQLDFHSAASDLTGGYAMLKKVIFLFLLMLSVPLSAAAASVELPRTGQDLCYNDLGPITCTGTGQDGETRFGTVWPAPRFTDNGNGTVTDNLSGLIWLKDAHCLDIQPAGGSDWPTALAAAIGLHDTSAGGPITCGLSDASVAGDWRLPNVNEMESLIDLSRVGPPLPLDHPFLNTDAASVTGWYWTSTITAVFPSNAEAVHYFFGSVRGDVKVNNKNVWPVKGVSTKIPRTGQIECWDVVGVPVPCPPGADGAKQTGAAWPALRFTDNNDGTITDTLTGLIWLKQADCIGNKNTQSEALVATKALVSGTCSLSDGSLPGDWRLPNRNEMRSMVSYQQSDGGAWLGTQGFSNPSGKSIGGWYWTSDSYPVVPDTNLKWLVKTEGGTWLSNDVAITFPTDPKLTLPVRGPLKIQPITFNTATRTFGDAPIDLSALASGGGSGNPLTFTLVSGPGALSGPNNATLTLTGAGNIIVQAAQAGNATFLPATDIQQTIIVNKATATVTLGNLSQGFDGTAKSATATTAPAGKTVVITYNGSPVAPSAAGSYAVVATITDANFQGSASGTLLIGKASATVTLGSLNQTYDGTAKSATVTTLPSGKTVTVTYNGSPVVPVNAGSYAVVATVTDAGFQGSASGTLVIAKASATVTLGSLNQTYDGTAKGATATTLPAGKTVTISYGGSPTVPINAGSYAVLATINDANFQGSANGTLVIGKASATVTLGSLVQTYDGTAKSATAITLPSGKSVTFSYGGSPTVPINAGSYAVVATINDANFTGSANGLLSVNHATPPITWSAPAPIVSGTALSATQLNATSSVAGSFVYSPAAGVVPAAGPQTLSATLTPADAVNYKSATATTLLTVIPTYTVTFASGGNGTLTGTANQTVTSGTSATPMTAVPATGYHFVQWTGAGGFSSTDNPITLGNVTANQALTANFAVNTYLVTAGAPGGNGSISCTASVNYGSNAICTASPNAGYHLVALTDNDSDRLSAVSGGSFTISGVTGNHIVSAVFARPNGIVSLADGKTAPDVGDALAVFKMVSKISNASAADTARADIAPLGADGQPLGDGILDIYDVIGILRMVIGLN
jgi:uncharacterized repeat protein (TIGR02543 family)